MEHWLSLSFMACGFVLLWFARRKPQAVKPGLSDKEILEKIRKLLRETG